MAKLPKKLKTKNKESDASLFEWLLRLADDHLILSHRLSELCAHAPILEEDLALPNIGLDLLGQARALYAYAGLVEGRSRSEDDLVFFRTEREYRNLLLVEIENGDFAHTILRLLYFSVFMELTWRELTQSSDEHISYIAQKSHKETRYHVRHASEWAIRLGDGTPESARRMGEAYAALDPYVGEMFEDDEVIKNLVDRKVVINPSGLSSPWLVVINDVFDRAGMTDRPTIQANLTGGRLGQHHESMGYLLAELQYMQRAYPDMAW